MACQPQEVSDWIRSKKKDMVPSVVPAQFGNQFSDWWMMMQPGWQKDDVHSVITLILYCDTPLGENWQGLRKGGTAGIYIVIMALSWWIKAQQTECDTKAWSAVEDISWVLHQMKQTKVSRVAPKKQARKQDQKEQEESQQKKR